MPNWYDIAEVKINGTGILAQNVSISSANSTDGLRSIGYSTPFQISPRGPIQGSVSFDYIVEVANEPHFLIASGLKNNWYPLGPDPIQVVVAGITGSGYLQSYSIQIPPNAPAKGSVTYSVFSEFSGQNSTGITTTFDATKTSGIGHFWSTYLLPSTPNGQVFGEFSYKFDANWQPLYVIGQKNPTQVQLGNMTEEMSVTRNIFKPANFSGQASSDFLDGVTGFQVNGLEAAIGNQANSITFNISGAPVKNIDLSLAVSNYITVRSSVKKYY